MRVQSAATILVTTLVIAVSATAATAQGKGKGKGIGNNAPGGVPPGWQGTNPPGFGVQVDRRGWQGGTQPPGWGNAQSTPGWSGSGGVPPGLGKTK